MFEFDETADTPDAQRPTARTSVEDTRRPRLFLDPLMQSLLQDAWLRQDRAGAGTLVALAAEVADFGLGDDERSLPLYERAAAHADADPRAFAGLRRAARRDATEGDVLAVWEREFDAAATDESRVLAAIGLARHALRSQLDPGRVREALAECRVLLPFVAPGLAALWSLTWEDACVVAGDHEAALSARAERIGALPELGVLVAESCVDRASLTMAALCDALDADEESILHWLEKAHASAPSEQTLQALLRSRVDAQDWGGAEALLSEGVHACDSDARGRILLVLAQLRAWRLGDRSGALEALREGLRSSLHAPLAASTFLSLARELHGEAVLEGQGDALAARLEFAATAAERADLLTRMAQLYASRDDLLEPAIELAQEALAHLPAYGPAGGLLEELLARCERWDALVQVLEDRLVHVAHEEDRRLLHERLADLCLDRLGDEAEAEAHLRAALDCGAALRPVRRLSGLLEARGAWTELVDHLCTAAERIASPQVRAELLEQAARITETRLGQRDETIALLVSLLESAPRYNSTLAHLGRLLEDERDWELRLTLCDTELEAFSEDPEARRDVYVRAAEICTRELGDDARAEDWLRRALADDDTNLTASLLLGQLLTKQRRWEDLARLEALNGRAHREAERKLGSLQRLGELLATRTGEFDRAVTCFEQLLAADEGRADLALVWLERIHEARGDRDALLDVLVRRRRLVPDPQMDARLAFRIAEHLEFRQDRVVEAFDAWVDALADPLAADVAIDAIDRLWRHKALPTDARERALGSVNEVARRESPALRRRAYALLADRLLPRNIDAVVERRMALAEEWPHDLYVGEYCAIMALREGEAAAAASWRSTRDVSPIETAAAALDAIDQGLAPTFEPDPGTPAELRAWLACERGSADGPFSGVEEREILELIREEKLSVGELLVAEGTELRRRLAVFAARALGDPDNLVAAWHQLIETRDDDLLRMRALLDMARDRDVPAEEAIRRLAEADGHGAFDHPMRAELYDIMEQRGAWSELENALGAHVREGGSAPENAALLSLRRARALTRLRREGDALEALRYGIVCAPGNAEIALEKARIEVARDDVPAARETIESCLDAGVDDDARLQLLARLADLHEREGGEPSRLLECLEDAYAVSGGESRWGIRLARAHGTSGNPRRALSLYRECLQVPAVADELHHWLDLASVADRRARRSEEAEGILWELLIRFPERQEVLGELESFQRRHRQAHAFANQLRSLLEDGLHEVVDRRRGELWLYLGELETTVLHHHALAEDALERAERALPERRDIALRRARVIAAQPGRYTDALALLRRIISSVSEPILAADAADLIATLAAESGDRSRAHLASEVGAVLRGTPLASATHLKRDPEPRPGLARVLSLTRPSAADPKALAVLRALAPLAERALAEELPNRRELRATRVRSDEYPELQRYTELAARCLDVPTPRVYLSDTASTVQVTDIESFVLPSALIEDGDDLALRFSCGWGVLASALGLGVLVHAPDESVNALLRALAARTLHRDEWAGGEVYDRIGGIRNASARRSAAQALSEYEAILSADADGLTTPWRAIADRVGLLCCGDIATATDHVARTSTTGGNARDRTQELLAWSLGDRHAALRHEAGLAPSPIRAAEDTSPRRTH